MKRLLMLSCVLVFSACKQQTISYKEISQRTEQSKVLIKTFSEQLKQELKSAMITGGLIQAIKVCHERAPIIAQQLSKESGWDIYRTSLKPRAKSPDAWEKQMLLSFEQRHADGDKFKSLFNQDVTLVNDKASFRYIQAIETQAVCLTCHGKNIAEEVAEKIAQLYPSDLATGYKLGDIRGAFSIVQPLE